MSDTTPTRSINGTTVPSAGKYAIDPTHSAVRFTVRHLGLSKVRGGFERFSGDVVIADDPAASSVEVSLEADSFSTGTDDRDQHVKSGDFLDIGAFPTIVFRSTGVRADGDDWKVDGELTVKDVSKPVVLDVTFDGAGGDPWGGSRIAFGAVTEIDRDDWGINWNQTLETGGLLVGKKVKIEIDVQAVAQG